MHNIRRFFYNATIGIVLVISIVLASVNFASADTESKAYYDDMDGSFNDAVVDYQNLSTLYNGSDTIKDLFFDAPDNDVMFLNNADGSGMVTYGLTNVSGVKQVDIGFYTTHPLTGHYHGGDHELGLPNSSQGTSLHLYKHNGKLLIDCGYCFNSPEKYFREAVYSNGNYKFENAHYTGARPGDPSVTRIGLSVLATLKDGGTRIIPVNAAFSGTNPTSGNDIASVSEFSNQKMPNFPVFYYEASLNLADLDNITSLGIILEGYNYLNPMLLPGLFGFANVSMEVMENEEETSSSEETSSESSEGSSSTTSSGETSNEESNNSSSGATSSSSISSSSESSKESSSSSSTSSRPSSSSNPFESSYEPPTVPGVEFESSSSESRADSSKTKENVSSSKSQTEKISSTKSKPDSIKDEESEKDDSRLVIDANNKDNSTADNSNIDSNNTVNNIIDNEDTSHETTPFIPTVPKSLATADEPSIEKVVGSSLIVSAAAVVYVIFHKKMLSLL